MKLPHIFWDNVVAWGGIAIHLQTVNMVLSTCALCMTIVASALGIYTAYRNLVRTRDNIVDRVEKGK